MTREVDLHKLIRCLCRPDVIITMVTVLLASAIMTSSSVDKEQYNGTTPNIREIFMGKCWEFQYLLDKDRQSIKNCTLLWELFSRGFMYKDPCNVTSDDYQPFVDAAVEPTRVNQTTLWSGVYSLSSAYSYQGQRTTTIAYTLLGYMFNHLHWCGQKEPPGINYRWCPGYHSCHGSQYGRAFWRPASIAFAKQAHGTVNVLLSATNEGREAVPSDSLLYTAELPNLNPERVLMVRVLLTRVPGLIVRENCTHGSVPKVRDLVTSRGMQFQCIDDPSDLRHLQCVDSSGLSHCQFLMTSATQLYHNIRVEPVRGRGYNAATAARTISPRDKNDRLVIYTLLAAALITVFVES